MTISAFISTSVPSVRIQPVAKTSTRIAVRCEASSSRRARTVSPAPCASPVSTSPSPPRALTSDESLHSNFADTMTSLGVTLTALYLGMEISPALAVPEAIVETFKSKPASLVHPAVMWTIFGTTLYTFYLGWQSRSIRSAEPAVRKELVKSRVTQRHFETSATLFAVMTIATFGGMANTFTRTGKLFPGPHLYSGLGLVAIMATMVAFVPRMQKGNNSARNIHFALAFPVVALFAWQAQSGMEIVYKLLGWS